MSSGKSTSIQFIPALLQVAAAICVAGGHAAAALMDEAAKARARAEERRRLAEARRQAEERQREARRLEDAEIRRLAKAREQRLRRETSEARNTREAKRPHAGITQQRREERRAAELVAELFATTPPASDAEAALRDGLALAAEGAAPLSPELIAAADALRATRRAAVAREHRDQAAVVLEATLRDLGYDTDPVADTLFVEGGGIHYQRSDWGDYYMQMRLAPDGGQADFAVVRVGEGDPAADAASQEAICSEASLVELGTALAARGLELRVTHALAAGAAPVEQIDESALGETLRTRRESARGSRRRRKPATARTAGT